MRKSDFKKGVFLLPNILTTANLFCGFFALIRAIHGDFITAVWVLMLSGLFDLLDGRVARMTKGHSRFGTEYDSLVDLCSFGLTPALIMYLWVLRDFQKFGWTAAFIYFACTALRLARFNVQSGDVEKKGFQGLPSPAGAGCMISFILMHTHIYGAEARPPIGLILTYVVALAILMVSNVPYGSFKALEDGKRNHFFTLVAMLGVFVLIANEPNVMFFVVGMVYVGYGLLRQGLSYLRPSHLSRKPDAVEPSHRGRKKKESVLKVIEGGE